MADGNISKIQLPNGNVYDDLCCEHAEFRQYFLLETVNKSADKEDILSLFFLHKGA